MLEKGDDPLDKDKQDQDAGPNLEPNVLAQVQQTEGYDQHHRQQCPCAHDQGSGKGAGRGELLTDTDKGRVRVHLNTTGPMGDPDQEVVKELGTDGNRRNVGRLHRKEADDLDQHLVSSSKKAQNQIGELNLSIIYSETMIGPLRRLENVVLHLHLKRAYH